MKVTGFSGKSGSGKSYISSELCGRLGIDAMIDDGLLISRGNILAGISAKKQDTRMGAVKTALFTSEEHRVAVRDALRELSPGALMVIGTSDKMVGIICERLEIPQPSEYIHIEDVSSADQIERASKMRSEAGTHIIPAPTMQVRKQFSGYFLDPKKSFRKDGQEEQHGEKTVVRPTYSYMGDFEISEKVISDIVLICASGISGITDVVWTASTNADEGMYIRTIIRCAWPCAVKTAALTLQRKICDAVSAMTAFNILGIEIEVREFYMKS